ncbi:ankyrin repeat domain-containing protein [Rickettsiales endosymbiont of Stachyamoeba lipophora]|uniref:ankyrin repeat domain-containing protein n=1 Tax=Rickettsiales endosymbiont of Stachyamoeba lipophora TaxID=2486578 RepID=UPI000F64CA25|nr:ankyrin repeat domain-containing protein [Rickettsiales endosymbiont of Stachyamoeba lipophora]AZL15084.1 ankyrin repeat domain-containing protein [Rickettsiales endosymbiont of Stachyamoeba lipophora]
MAFNTIGIELRNIIQKKASDQETAQDFNNYLAQLAPVWQQNLKQIITSKDIKDNSNTLLHYAVMANKPQVLEILIELGGKLSLPDKNGLPPLHHAWLPLYNIIQNAELTDEQKSAEINEYIAQLEQQGWSQNLITLIINYQNPKDKNNNLSYYAAQINIQFTVRRLIAAGAQIDLANQEGVRPLNKQYLANQEDIGPFNEQWLKLYNIINNIGLTDDETIVKINEFLPNYNINEDLFMQIINYPVVINDRLFEQLIDCQDIINDEDAKSAMQARNKNNTMLLFLAQKQKPKTLKFLVEKGADINWRNFSFITALYFAVWKNNIEAGKILLEKGADLNKANNAGNTPLHQAAIVGRIEFVDMLLAKNADFNILNWEGKTPLDLAKEHKHNDIALKLLAVGGRSKSQMLLEEQQETLRAQGLIDRAVITSQQQQIKGPVQRTTVPEQKSNNHNQRQMNKLGLTLQTVINISAIILGLLVVGLGSFVIYKCLSPKFTIKEINSILPFSIKQDNIPQHLETVTKEYAPSILKARQGILSNLSAMLF